MLLCGRRMFQSYLALVVLLYIMGENGLPVTSHTISKHRVVVCLLSVFVLVFQHEFIMHTFASRNQVILVVIDDI